MTAPLFDLCSAAPVAPAMGYHRAGFDVVGVDIGPSPATRSSSTRPTRMTFPLDGFDAIHACPPCQAFTQMSARWRGQGGES